MILRITEAMMLWIFLMATIVIAKENDMLELGTRAPEFMLLSDRGDIVNLHDFQGKKYVVLIFYPGDQTPGCTKQLCEVRDSYDQFSAIDAVVFGINPQDQKSHAAFVKKQHFQFPLLVDKDKMMVKAYRCEGPVMTTRTVYVIDKEGLIIYAKRGMPPPSEILNAIRARERPEGF